MSKFDLFRILGTRQEFPLTFYDSNAVPHTGYLQSVQKEDGSGNNFNVTIYNEVGQRETFFMRTT